MKLAMMIIFAIVSVALLGFAFYKSIKLVKNKIPNLINYPSEIKKLGYIDIATTVSFIALFIFYVTYNNFPLTGGEWVELIFGSMLFGLTVTTFFISFIVHYYGKELPKKLNKGLYISMLTSLVAFFIALILLTNSFADYITYPLVNAISFSRGFIQPGGDRSASIAFYALFILGGAVLVYFLCDHRFYQEYGKHGILESTLYVAFPAGIIAARIGYVIGNWNGDLGGIESFASRCARGEWWSIFAVWEGGLTILAGAIGGIVAGVLWFKFRKKQYSLWLAMDVIVPAILIAQAVGRMGNFFNCEVYGQAVLAENCWIFPKIITNNMVFTTQGVVDPNLAPGYIHLPLFLIEALINVAGYFVIRYGLGRGLKKYIEPGDLAASYLIWYGLVRVLLEPLRDASFNMGTQGYWSWFWSFFFIVGGALLIAANHVIRFIVSVSKKKNIVLKHSFQNGIIFTSIFSVVAIALIVVGTVMLANSTYVATLSYNQFSNGLLILILGISVLLMDGVSIPHIIQGSLAREK